MNIGLEKYRYYFETLRENPLFKDISNESLAALLKISTSLYWEKKTCILDTDNTFHKFYIIIFGKVKVYNFDPQNNRELTLNILTDSDIFNVCTLINGDSSILFYEALDFTEVLWLPIDLMRQWMADNPAIYKPFLSYVVKKTEKLEVAVSDLCLKNTSTRLANLLVQHLNIATNKIEVINGLSHDELAALIGTTRAVLNRHLQEFKEDGILKIKRKNIEIIDLPLLIQKMQTASTETAYFKN
ncbi:Crp/Fnr family transcriptional regulator [Arenibacter sp. 6A1]|uniref:Crp/Fnr family transcriptional regulator n=1 Tax=Arenibacter sp. 6A1 TaxID=2720391 RepID=UPI001444C461|nr:Crp/Fnr family transcriptional regulator [Arenibacter sp. 6A1]NKI25893.1 Crp/Fnr family transcriptional regulator [Arenibacter sp. 6A1]